MKIDKSNYTVYAGAPPMGTNDTCNDAEKKKTIFAGNFAGTLNDPVSERIAQKKEAARKQAAKVLTDQFAADKEITDLVEERRVRKKELLEERAELKNAKKEAEDQLEELQNIVPSTEEEQSELEARIADKEKTVLGIGHEVWKKGEEIRAEDITLRQTRIDMAKLDGIVDAVKSADSIMENASDQIVGMLIQDAKEHIDEELQEKIEQAQEQRVEKEEQEEKLEKTEAAKEETEAVTEVIRETSNEQIKVDRELKEIIKENELLEEEIKGLIVDSGV